MKKLTFKNKKAFARAIIKYGRLYSTCGTISAVWDIKTSGGFMISDKGSIGYMVETWNDYNKEWLTERLLKDKDLVWCWNNDVSHSRVLRFYYKFNDGVYSINGHSNGGGKYTNYKKANLKKLPKSIQKWAEKARKMLK